MQFNERGSLARWKKLFHPVFRWSTAHTVTTASGRPWASARGVWILTPIWKLWLPQLYFRIVCIIFFRKYWIIMQQCLEQSILTFACCMKVSLSRKWHPSMATRLIIRANEPNVSHHWTSNYSGREVAVGVRELYPSLCKGGWAGFGTAAFGSSRFSKTFHFLVVRKKREQLLETSRNKTVTHNFKYIS